MFPLEEIDGILQHLPTREAMVNAT